MKNTLITLLLFVFLISCNDSDNTRYKKLVVASERIDCLDCFGIMEMNTKRGFLVKEEGSTDWITFYNHIEGFNYESGYEYIIEIKIEDVKNPPADGSSIRCILTKEISKIKKPSKGIPEACDESFYTILISVKDKENKPYGLDSIKVFLKTQEGHKDISIVKNFDSDEFKEYQKSGEYPVVNDILNIHFNTEEYEKTLALPIAHIHISGYKNKTKVFDKYGIILIGQCHVSSLNKLSVIITQ